MCRDDDFEKKWIGMRDNKTTRQVLWRKRSYNIIVVMSWCVDRPVRVFYAGNDDKNNNNERLMSSCRYDWGESSEKISTV